MIDLAVPFSMRERCLEVCLKSVPSDELSAVYICSNSPNKPEIDLDYDFPVEVVDCGKNYSVGEARWKGYVESDSDYLLVTDSDVRFPPTILPLLDILESDGSLGGVSGCLVESNHNRIRIPSKNFKAEGKKLIQSSQIGESNVEFVGGYPISRFHKTPHITLYRRKCLDDYAWDPEYLTRAHLDFYIGHWLETDWDFASTPVVGFFHESLPFSDEYESLRYDKSRHQQGLKRIRKKWGFSEVSVEGEDWLYMT